MKFLLYLFTFLLFSLTIFSCKKKDNDSDTIFRHIYHENIYQKKYHCREIEDRVLYTNNVEIDTFDYIHLLMVKDSVLSIDGVTFKITSPDQTIFSLENYNLYRLELLDEGNSFIFTKSTTDNSQHNITKTITGTLAGDHINNYSNPDQRDGLYHIEADYHTFHNPGASPNRDSIYTDTVMLDFSNRDLDFGTFSFTFITPFYSYYKKKTSNTSGINRYDVYADNDSIYIYYYYTLPQNYGHGYYSYKGHKIQ